MSKIEIIMLNSEQSETNQVQHREVYKIADKAAKNPEVITIENMTF